MQILSFLMTGYPSLRGAALQGVYSLILMLAFAPTARAMSVSYTYNLSDTAGTVKLTSPKLFADSKHREIFAVDEDSTVRVFNKSGMETYRFNDDRKFGLIVDIAVDKDGNILLLTSTYEQGKWKQRVVRCDFRGEPQSILALSFPGDFHPSSMASQGGRLYFADKGTMRVLVATEEGMAERTIDLPQVLSLDAKTKSGLDLSGFSVDREGNILFTVPVLFRAYILAPDGKLTSFGQAGSRPGGFNIAAGIVTDDAGHYFVSDKLKCAVLVFDKDLNFVDQFGYRGDGPGGLIVPMDMAVLNDKLYVSQGAQRGVSVFSINR